MIGFAKLLYKVGVSRLALSSELIEKSKWSWILFSSISSLLENWWILLKYRLGSPKFGFVLNWIFWIDTSFSVFSKVFSGVVLPIKSAISVYWYRFSIVKWLAELVLFLLSQLLNKIAFSILKIGDSFLLAKGKIESSKFFFKINLSIKSLPKNDK